MKSAQNREWSLDVEGVSVRLVRKNVRNLRISVHPPDGGVRVSAPLRMPEFIVRQFVRAKAGWVRSRQADIAARPVLPPLDRKRAKQHLHAQIPALQEKWQPRLGVAASEVRLRHMRTRWGSCNVRTGRIWLNLELARHDPACLEYVFVHELVHLIERGHGPRFKALMDGYLPGWKDLRAELNEGAAG